MGNLNSVAGGFNNTCAILNDGSVKCWGRNHFGQLGLGDLEDRGDEAHEMGSQLAALDLGSGRSAKAISLGISFACAILDNDLVKCWGDGTGGKLGQENAFVLGDEANEMGDLLEAVDLGSGRTVKSLSAGALHTCVVLDDFSVKCWGYNTYGQLGYGDINTRGGNPGTMGNFLEPVDLGSGRTAKMVSSGANHSCAVLDNDSVKCWGLNTSGALGLGDTAHRGTDPNQMGDDLPAVGLGVGRTAKAVAAGGAHTCALLDNGRVKCWGANGQGQLGQGSAELVVGDEGGEMGDSLPYVQLGQSRTVQAISAKHYHTCALLDDNTTKCWGVNSQGMLGQGDTEDRGLDSDQMGNQLAAVKLGSGKHAKEISTGYYQSCAILSDRHLKCWGRNQYGELGFGDIRDRADQPNEMGDRLRSVEL